MSTERQAARDVAEELDISRKAALALVREARAKDPELDGYQLLNKCWDLHECR